MDLEGLRKAVRTIARDGEIAHDVIETLSATDRRSVMSLARRARKAGGLDAVTPPAHNAFWMAPVGE
jgi:hypothetical protein